MGNLLYNSGPYELWNIDGVTMQKIIIFVLKLYLHLPKENKERKLCQGARDFS